MEKYKYKHKHMYNKKAGSAGRHENPTQTELITAYAKIKAKHGLTYKPKCTFSLFGLFQDISSKRALCLKRSLKTMTTDK